MEAFIPVIGKDTVGIIAGISALLAKEKVNIEDISQTIMQDNFTMIMRVDTAECALAFDILAEQLKDKGEEIGVAINLRHEDIFNAMHRI
jgi:ACT domain-containing protein